MFALFVSELHDAIAQLKHALGGQRALDEAETVRRKIGLGLREIDR